MENNIIINVTENELCTIIMELKVSSQMFSCNAWYSEIVEKLENQWLEDKKMSYKMDLIEKEV